MRTPYAAGQLPPPRPKPQRGRAHFGPHPLRSRLGISQGWKLTGAIKTAEGKLADKSLRHSGQGLMAWAVANARVEPNGNAIIITKQASGSAKIDSLLAAFDAVALMTLNPAAQGEPEIVV